MFSVRLRKFQSWCRKLDIVGDWTVGLSGGFVWQNIPTVVPKALGPRWDCIALWVTASRGLRATSNTLSLRSESSLRTLARAGNSEFRLYISEKVVRFWISSSNWLQVVLAPAPKPFARAGSRDGCNGVESYKDGEQKDRKSHVCCCLGSILLKRTLDQEPDAKVSVIGLGNKTRSQRRH